SLQSWGSGDVRVNTTYDSDVTTYTRESDTEDTTHGVITTWKWVPSGTTHQTLSTTQTAAAADSNAGFSVWLYNGGSNNTLSNTTIDSVQVQKYVNGSWVTIFDTAAPGGIQSRIEVGAMPANVAHVSLSATLAAGGTTNLTLNPLGNFWLVPYAGLSAGSYTYTLTATDSNNAVVDLRSLGGTASGTFSGSFTVNRPSGGTAWIRADGMAQTQIPLTAYEYDLLGNRIAQIQYATPQMVMPSDGQAPAGLDPANDQVTYSRYDARGNVVETVEINNQNNTGTLVEGQGNFNTVEDRSYDKLGRVARVWTQQSLVTTGSQVQVKTYSYDSVGRQASVLEVVRNAGTNPDSWVKTDSVYDPFGEQIQKTTSTIPTTSPYSPVVKGQVYYDYDADGRLWQTDQDGVDTVYRYDLAGKATAKITVPSVASGAYTPIEQASLSAALSVSGTIEADTVYDRLERAVDQIDAGLTQNTVVSSAALGVQFSATPASSLTYSNLVSTRTSTRYYNADALRYEYAVTVTNSVDLSWSAVAANGTNDLTVSLTDANGGSASLTLSSSQSPTTAHLSWHESENELGAPGDGPQAISSLSSAEVDQLVNGTWEPVRSISS